MDTDILSMIACNRDDLSKSENRIASFIAADPEWVINSTISELAGQCHVSPPTISRFCWKLGLSGFPDLKLELMRSITSTPDETDLSETWIDEENNWDEIMGMIGGCYQKAITKTIKQADKQLLSAVCKKWYPQTTYTWREAAICIPLPWDCTCNSCKKQTNSTAIWMFPPWSRPRAICRSGVWWSFFLTRENAAE